MNSLVKILVVEDNEDDWEATRRSFQKNHFLNEIKWCQSGQEAWHYLKPNRTDAGESLEQLPELILLDLNMPGIDGRQLLELIKADPKLKAIPVIVLTTSDDQRDISRCYELGASTYIQKPVTFDGLTNAVKTLKDYWFGVALLPKKSGELV